MTENQLHDFMKEKGAERRRIRDERLKDSQELQATDRKIRKLNVDFLENLKDESKYLRQTETNYLAIFSIIAHGYGKEVLHLPQDQLSKILDLGKLNEPTSPPSVNEDSQDDIESQKQNDEDDYSSSQPSSQEPSSEPSDPFD